MLEPIANGVPGGHVRRTGWTGGSDQRDAFVVLDRNGNGLIDDGSELFGNYTPLAAGGRAPNGYVALRELDSRAAGGNGNGYLDSGDASFASLRLWVDSNQDRVSQASELTTIGAAGVLKLHYEYRTSQRRDRHGNLLRYKSGALMMSRPGIVRIVPTLDVFFVSGN